MRGKEIVRSFREVSTDEDEASYSFSTPQKDDEITDYDLELTCHAGRCSTFKPKSDPLIKTAKKIIPKSRKQVQEKFWKEIEALQHTSGYLLSRKSFARLVREVILEFSEDIKRITPEALNAIQTATEQFISQHLQDAYLLTLHRGQMTLTKKDFDLLKIIKVII